MEWKSTKNMKNEEAPKGTVLVKYLEPSWGGWNLQYGMAYFDNPNDYENPEEAEGWRHDNTCNTLNVVSYCELPHINQEIENPFYKKTPKDIFYEFGTYTPNNGNVGI